MADEFPEQTYRRFDSIVVWRTAEPYGALSNFAREFPVVVNGVTVPSSEALFQACKYPHNPGVQEEIIEAGTPKLAKQISKQSRPLMRKNWHDVRVDIMRWCLDVKLTQHFSRIWGELLSTGRRPIVEQSSTDTFWGAKPIDPEHLRGSNVLGRLLTDLRDDVEQQNHESPRIVHPPSAVPDFLLLGHPIGVVGSDPASVG